VGHLANLDLMRLWREGEKAERLNYVQALTGKSDGIESVGELLSYLFDWTEPGYRDPYQHNEQKRQLIRASYDTILANHGTATEYFKWVSLRLWRPADWLAENYGEYLQRATKMLEWRKTGQPCVFAGIVDNKVTYC
jgi:hypothetical protein